jgi:hypothetical protein
MTLMILFTGTAHSPMSFYANKRYPGAEDGTSRVASSSRPNTRISDVDFDQLPSHRPRKSGANGSPLRPSTLSQSHLPDPDTDDNNNQGGMDGDFEDYAPPEDDYAPQNDTPRRSSFTQIDRDEEDEDEDQDNAQTDPESPIRNSSKGKTKGRTQIPDSEDNQADPGTEDAIAQGLEDVELDVPSEDEDDQHLRKKPRTEKQAQRSKTPRGRSRKREKVIKERSRRSKSSCLLYSSSHCPSSHTAWCTTRSTTSLPPSRMVATREGCLRQYRRRACTRPTYQGNHSNTKGTRTTSRTAREAEAKGHNSQE